MQNLSSISFFSLTTIKGDSLKESDICTIYRNYSTTINQWTFFFLIFCSSPIHCSTQEIVLSKANNFRFLKDDAHLVLQIIRTLTSKQSELLLHKCCSEGNVSYFIMLADNIRGGCWWYSSRGWTFPPIFCYILLLCNRWQQRGSLTEWHLTWKCGWSKGGSLNSSMQKIVAPLKFNVNGDQWVWAQWGCGWCVSTVAAVTVGHLFWCSFLWAWHAGSCSSVAEMQC